MGLNQSIPPKEKEEKEEEEVPLPRRYNTDPRKILEFLRACHQGNIEDINRLIKNDINPSSPENRGLIIASSNGNLDVVNLLLRNDLVNSKNPSTFIAAATAAILNEHLDVFYRLLTKIEKVKLSDYDKNLLNRPLITASDRALTLLSLEYSDISDRLIKLGANRSVDRRPRPGFSHKNKKSPKKVSKSSRKSARKSIRKSVRKSARKSIRKSARKSARKSIRKSVRKSAPKSARKSIRKSVRKSARKSARKTKKSPKTKKSVRKTKK